MAGKSSAPVPRRDEPIHKVIKPFQEFARLEASGGLVLLAATVLALFWANSPWSASYFELFRKTYVTVGVADFKIDKPLLLWINDGLMAVFFLLVGLEIKREVLTGELASLRRAALPIVAALGGMVVPALIYVVFNPETPNLDGWGIPMATDIAFALGILSLAGRAVPVSLKVFLVAFAIVDDLGAVAVIALFYTDTISLGALGLGFALLAALWLLGRLGVRSLAVFLLVGIPIWVAFLKSGVHATVAGVLLAMVIPHRSALPGVDVGKACRSVLDHFDRAGGEGDEESQHGALTALTDLGRQARSSLSRLEHALHPLVMFFIMPVFAFANAGVTFIGGGGGELTGPIGLGILLGLFVGKQIGVFGFAWIGLRAGLAERPQGVTMRHLYGAALLGGVGFTMSLFIANLAFGEGMRLESAKLAILTASAISGVAGWLLLKTAPKQEAEA